MRRLLALPLVLLFASPASALLSAYHWNGTADWGDTREQTNVSGSIHTDGNMVRSLTLDIGSYRYVFIPQFYEAYGLSPVSLMDAPLVSEDMTSGGDLQFFEGSKLWAFQWREGDEDSLFETGGSVTNFFKDASPTPEPSSVALMASALLGFGGFRLFRRRNRV